ncbi:UNVERIFIED_CONTAM: hypothetical protein NCL1_21323 [Trichonephila clavipes]
MDEQNEEIGILMIAVELFDLITWSVRIMDVMVSFIFEIPLYFSIMYFVIQIFVICRMPM